MVGSNELGLDHADRTGASSQVAVRTDESIFAAKLLDASEAAFRVIRSLGLSPDDAADALQEASIRAWRHRESCRGEFRPWFIAIAYREARRPRRRWLTVPAFWHSAGNDAQSPDTSDALTAALQTLPRRQRVAISLRYDADMSIADVASALRVSEPAAKQLLARAREALRHALAAEDQKVDS